MKKVFNFKFQKKENKKFIYFYHFICLIFQFFDLINFSYFFISCKELLKKLEKDE